MRVLQVNCVYSSGSTGKIVYDIHHGLKQNGFESVVCYGNGANTNEQNVYKINTTFLGKVNALGSRVTGIKYGGCVVATNRLIRIIKRDKPDAVHVHCINGHMVNIYRIISFLKKSGIRTVLTLHAEFMHTANCGYALDCDKWKTGCGKCPRLKQETKSWLFDGTHKSWMKMKKAFDGFNDNLTVVSVSPWLMERAKQSPILEGKNHTVVFNGLDTDVFKAYDTKDLRDKHGITDEKVIFHATPSFNNDKNHIKGGYYILELAKMLKNENVKFVVAGSYDESIEIPDNMIMLGRVSDQRELARYYSMADLTVLTSKKETFSMVVAESLCCGTPVVGFKAGAPEQIAIKEYSEFVEQADLDALYKAVVEKLSIAHKNVEISEKGKETYSKEKMVEEYIEIYKS